MSHPAVQVVKYYQFLSRDGGYYVVVKLAGWVGEIPLKEYQNNICQRVFPKNDDMLEILARRKTNPRVVTVRNYNNRRPTTGFVVSNKEQKKSVG